MGVPLPFPIADALARGATALTPSRRAARSVRRAFDAAQQAQGLTQWAPPAILPLEAWLAAAWRNLVLEGHRTRTLLNRTQELALWRLILAADPDLPSLRTADSLAALAARAWSLLHLYGGTAHAREFAVSTDTRAFARWAVELERRCTRERWLTAAELPAALLAAVKDGSVAVPAGGFVLIDFESQPPAHTALFEAMGRAGYAVEALQSPAKPALGGEVYAAPDDLAELRAAAGFVRDQLTANSGKSIAVVVPNLADRRAAIDRVFSEVLAPALLPVTAIGNMPYEFSLGRPLAETAPVETALLLLRWVGNPLSIAAVGKLLVSPFFASAAGATAPESLAAAEFDVAELRRLQVLRPELSLESLTALVRESRHATRLTGLLGRLQRMHRAAAADQLLPVPGALEGPRQTFAEWTDSFRNVLEAAGWTEAVSTGSSLAFQTHRRWESALDEVATLDFSGAPPTAADALEAMGRIMRETIFAPESHDAPVQILGPLEVGGVPFDTLWFLGADDLTWPAPASASPLLPFALQRTLGMPGTDAALDAAAARALTVRLAASAASVVFSFAAEAEEGSRRPSSALAALSLKPHSEPVQPPLRDVGIPSVFIDSTPMPALPDRVVSGGAAVLKLQAACPFRAFAEYRLRSRALESRDPGFDARERGNLVHTVMEAFWSELGNQEALKNLSGTARLDLLDGCIRGALAQASARAQTPWDDAYLAVEHERLQALLAPWLEVELTRPPFEVADEEKALHDVRLGPLRLSLRVDRIDHTGGGPLILDYKTGVASPAEWLGERPDEPQLPLYAVLTASPTNDLGGVAFASLRPGTGLSIKGVAGSADVLNKSARLDAVDLAEQVDLWRETLVRLADNFAAGDARVDPKAYPRTCERCDQRILCRLDPGLLDHFDDPDAEVARG